MVMGYGFAAAAQPGLAPDGRPEIGFPRRGRGFMFFLGRPGRAAPSGRPPVKPYTLDRPFTITLYQPSQQPKEQL
jgi:hypothetical protein